MTSFSLSSGGTGRTARSRSAVAYPAVVLALLFAVAGAFPQHARAQVSTTAVPFLMIEPDSRSAGMGNTGVALADNANAIWWNPAGLAFQKGAEVGITHTNWLPEFDAGLYFDYLVGKYHVDGVGTFGGQVAFMNLGEHERRNETNEQVGTFRSFDLAVGASYGVKLGERLALGTGARMIYSQLAGGLDGIDGTAFGVGVDLAGLYRTRPFSLGGIATTVSTGLNLSNMGPTITYESGEDPIPQHLRFGLASTFEFDEFNQLTFAADFGKMLTDVEVTDDTTAENRREVAPFYEAIFSSWKPADIQDGDGQVSGQVSPLGQITMGAGLEYWYAQLFALRTGYYYENPDFGGREFLTFGAGLRYNIIGVDFSYIFPMEENDPLANTIRLSLLVDIPSRTADAAGAQ